jgi:hypothetical protein
VDIGSRTAAERINPASYAEITITAIGLEVSYLDTICGGSPQYLEENDGIGVLHPNLLFTIAT